jgi:uncharacterized membrane protein YgaE (UPF0421/DUF939 family)
MDILYLVDRLEQLVNQSRRVPLSSRVMLEEEELLALVEQLRQTIPNEVSQAKRLLKEQERIITSAQNEADKIVAMARERAEYMINDNNVYSLAKERGEQVLNDAQRDAFSTRQEIQEYAVAVLGNLAGQLQSQLHQVENGLSELQPPRLGRVS